MEIFVGSSSTLTIVSYMFHIISCYTIYNMVGTGGVPPSPRQTVYIFKL